MERKELLSEELLSEELLSSVAIPKEFAPKEFAPKEFAPKEFAPKEFVPGVFAPDETIPDETIPVKCVLTWEAHRWGENLRVWQMERHAEDLMPLVAAAEELARRILASYPHWEVQHQVHLNHASLEVSSFPNSEKTVVECRWAEGHQWRGSTAIEMSLPIYAHFFVSGRPEQFVFNPDGPPDLIDAVLLEVKSEVDFHASRYSGSDQCDGSDQLYKRQPKLNPSGV